MQDLVVDRGHRVRLKEVEGYASSHYHVHHPSMVQRATAQDQAGVCEGSRPGIDSRRGAKVLYFAVTKTGEFEHHHESVYLCVYAAHCHPPFQPSAHQMAKLAEDEERKLHQVCLEEVCSTTTAPFTSVFFPPCQHCSAVHGEQEAKARLRFKHAMAKVQLEKV